VELAFSPIHGHGLVPAPFLAATVPGAVLSAAEFSLAAVGVPAVRAVLLALGVVGHLGLVARRVGALICTWPGQRDAQPVK
jgi:hypothetical protein